MVGGYRTMVGAVAMRTYGLGGDSEVRIDDRSLLFRLDLGPRRLVPLSPPRRFMVRPSSRSSSGSCARDTYGPPMRRTARRQDGRAGCVRGRSSPQEALFARIGPSPVARLISCWTATAQLATLDRLVARGLCISGGITPSDAMHVLGRQGQWDRMVVAELGLRLAMRRKNGAGCAIAVPRKNWPGASLSA